MGNIPCNSGIILDNVLLKNISLNKIHFQFSFSRLYLSFDDGNTSYSFTFNDDSLLLRRIGSN